VGTHTFKFGVQFHNDQVNEDPNATFNGTFNINGTATGSPFAEQYQQPKLEREVQGHLNLPWASDGLVHLAEANGRVIERLTLNGKIVVVLIL